jgi:hypothetical protein
MARLSLSSICRAALHGQRVFLNVADDVQDITPRGEINIG